MKPVSSALSLALMLGCSMGADMIQPNRAGAQTVADQAPVSAQYTLVKYTASLGGTKGRGNGINALGWIAGYSYRPDTTSHAAIWRTGSAITDLGTLGGPNSNVAWPGLNDMGVVAGISETRDMDPNSEGWSCAGFFAPPKPTHHVCRGFVWESGHMKELRPFPGGTNGFATGVNTHGKIVGWAENGIHDPTCKAPQLLQFRAATWDARTGAIEELHPLSGDSTSAATAINEKGQVVGISGACDVAVGEFSAKHAVMWQNGQVRDMGSLGGVAWNTPMDINSKGDAVGFSDSTNDADGSFVAHAVYWPYNGTIKRLAELPGDQTSQALGINNSGQIVGVSCGAKGCTAVTWKDGVPTDLNKLMGPDFADHMISAQHINELGKITGRVLDQATKVTMPFVATPISAKR